MSLQSAMTELTEEREALAARLTALKIEEIASRNQVRKFSIAHQIVFLTQHIYDADAILGKRTAR